MKKLNWSALLLALFLHSSLYAFETEDEQIDHYLAVLENGSDSEQITLLQQLQWSGLSNPRLYDVLEVRVLDQYLSSSLKKKEIDLIAHEVRALGFSGNEKYRDSLIKVNIEANKSQLRHHAQRALAQFDTFIEWNQAIADSTLDVEGKDVQTGVYMKMLSINNVMIQRLAARAIFHGNLSDPEMLAIASDQLKQLYQQEYLDNEAQDTAAWLCKAIGQSGKPEYTALLQEVVEKSPHKKIRKHASKYAG